MPEKNAFQQRLRKLLKQHREVVLRRNIVDESWSNGWFERYRYPVITNEHVPLFWRYDLNPETNPHLMERLGVNCVQPWRHGVRRQDLSDLPG